MNSTPTTAPRTINADVFRRIRAAGARLDIAAYAARPPVLDLTFEHDGDIADVARFELDGRTFAAKLEEPDGGCESCAELVDAWRRQDDGIAWITPDDFERMEHRVVTVEVLDADGEKTGDGASLYGVCGFDGTELERLLDERYLADTVRDLAHEAVRLAESAERAAAERQERERNARNAEREARLDSLTGLAERFADGHLTATHLRDEMRAVLGWVDETPRTLTFHSTIRGEEGPVTMVVDRNAGGADFPPQTFPV